MPHAEALARVTQCARGHGRTARHSHGIPLSERQFVFVCVCLGRAHVFVNAYIHFTLFAVLRQQSRTLSLETATATSASAVLGDQVCFCLLSSILSAYFYFFNTILKHVSLPQVLYFTVSSFAVFFFD